MLKTIFILFVILMYLNVVQVQALTLKEQLANNFPISEIQCADIMHVLTERPNGKLACVYPSTAEKLGWKIVNLDSDTTHAVFEILVDDKSFEIKYVIKGGNITEMIKNEKANSLVITIDSSNNGQVTLYIPHGIIDPIPKDSGDNFLFVLINGEEVKSKQTIDDELNRTVTINFTHPDPKIEIIAAYWT